MGLKYSSYRSIQWLIHLKLESYGNRRDKAKPFHWDCVELNLPGTPGYVRGCPWVMKIRCNGHLASEVYVYVDDGRATGFCPEICWAAASHFAAVCSNKGVQDAKRKRTFPSWTPGPWAGTITLTDGEIVFIVSKAKWDKTRCLINELRDMMDTAVSAPDQTSEGAKLPLQRLLEIRGFLIYVVRTYPWMSPYLKGLHNTIDR